MLSSSTEKNGANRAVSGRIRGACPKKNISGVGTTNSVKFGPLAPPKAPQMAIVINKQCVPINRVSCVGPGFFSLSEDPRGIGLQVYESIRIQALIFDA
jgi:hypothetical protein